MSAEVCNDAHVSRCGPSLLVVFGLLGCASGPHPAIVLAAKEFGCDVKVLKLHESYPRKVRVEGCGKEASYVKLCTGYGMDATCGWVRKQD
jgi:hypothetical protein